MPSPTSPPDTPTAGEIGRPTGPSHLPASRIVANLLLAAAALWCIYWFVHAWHYWEDDAYIHLEFARSIANHRGFSFNGHVVSGDTAPLWVLLLVAMHALIPDWLVAGKLLAALGVLLGLSGAYAFARRLALSLPASLSPSLSQKWALTLFPAALVLLIVVNPYFCYWAFSGMEPLAAVGVAFYAVLAATAEPPSPRAFLAGCFLAGIAPLLRPELVFLSVIVAFLLLAQWFRLPGRPSSPSRLAAFFAGLLLLFAPIVSWSLYSLHAFGRLIPNTNAAKRAGPHDSVVRHLLAIYAGGLPLVVLALFAGVLYLLLRPASVRNSLRRAFASVFPRAARSASASAQPSPGLPLAGWVFLLWPLITTLFYIANHTYVQTRYILVTAPGLIIVIVMLALLASRRLGAIVWLAAMLASLAVSIATVRPFIRNKAANCTLISDLSLYIRNQIPPDAPVAVYSIGEVAFVSQHPIIDTGGITRPGAIPYLDDPPEAMLRWARSQGAQYYVTDKQPGPGAVLVFSTNARFVGWTFHPALYSTTAPLRLWKLAPSQSSSPATTAAQSTQPVNP